MYTAIIQNPHFQTLMSLVRVARSRQWQAKHHVPIPVLERDILSALRVDAFDKIQAVCAFTALLSSVTMADSNLTYTIDDLDFIVEMEPSTLKTTLSLMAAYWSVPCGQ